MWYSRFRDDHPELQATFLKAVDKSRESWEVGGIEDLKDFFERLAHAFARSETGFNNGEIFIKVFQPIKNAHQKELRKQLRRGNISYSRLNFIKSFQEIFDAGFIAHNIISGFKKSSIFPPNPEPTTTYLLQKQLKAKKAVDPAYSSLLPSKSRFQVTSNTAKYIAKKYYDILSSLTRSRLQQSALAGSNNTITFNLSQPPTDESKGEEEEEEGEEELKMIDLTQYQEEEAIPRYMRSSPPLIGSSPTPEGASTPCPPPQQHISQWKRIQKILEEGRATRATSSAGPRDEGIA
ncbi:hypothetical protein ACJZ2D_016834 [Fusarium nematophilum]